MTEHKNFEWERSELVSALLKQADAWKDQGVPLEQIIEFPAAKLIEEQAERIRELEALTEGAKTQYAIEWFPGYYGAKTFPSREQAQNILDDAVEGYNRTADSHVVKRLTLNGQWVDA